MDSGRLFPYASVIVPVYNGATTIKPLLIALAEQDYPSDRREVVLIDNGSTDDTIEKIDAMRSIFTCPLIVLEETAIQGSYAARNRGLEAACGEVIAFTDADCIPAQDWLTTGVAALRQHGMDAVVGGQVEIFFEGGRTRSEATAVELYEEMFGFSREYSIFANTSFATANLFVWRYSFDRVGLFEVRLRSGGDFDWCWRAGESGLDLHHAPNCIVRHPARRTLKELLSKARRVAGGGATMRSLGLRKPFKKPTQALSGYAKAFISVLTNRQIPSFSKRAEIIGVVVLVKSVKTIERIRLSIHAARAQR